MGDEMRIPEGEQDAEPEVEDREDDDFELHGGGKKGGGLGGGSTLPIEGPVES